MVLKRCFLKARQMLHTLCVLYIEASTPELMWQRLRRLTDAAAHVKDALVWLQPQHVHKLLQQRDADEPVENVRYIPVLCSLIIPATEMLQCSQGQSMA